MKLNSISIQVLTVTVTLDYPLTMKVERMILPKGEEPEADGPWVEAEWVGEPDKERAIELLVVGSDLEAFPNDAIKLTEGSWSIWLRLTDNPEVLVFKAGETIVML